MPLRSTEPVCSPVFYWADVCQATPNRRPIRSNTVNYPSAEEHVLTSQLIEHLAFWLKSRPDRAAIESLEHG